MSNSAAPLYIRGTATFGLSITGVAGPTGGTKRSPVERVFIGLAYGRKVWVKKLDLKGTRREIKKKATAKSLQFLYVTLIEKSALKTRG
jgi:nicotinamide mononucleotide (NMN) deamidase PncC